MIQITVIVPVYNVEKYLSHCLEALIAQTFRDIEIICVDDGSTDSSLRILHEYAKKDKRIKVIHQENGGVSRARNVGLMKANGRFIMFCDPDDEFLPEMCQKMYELMNENKYDFVRCGVELISENNQFFSIVNKDYFECSVKSVMSTSSYEAVRMIDCVVWNKIFRRDLIDKYNLKFPIGMIHEDFAFYWKYVFISKDIMLTSDRLYRYFLRSNSYMTSTKRKLQNALDYARILPDIYKFLKDNFYEERIRCFLKLFAFVFDMLYQEMPENSDKKECYDLTVPILQEIGEKNIIKFSDDIYRIALISILNRNYIYYGKKYYGLGPLKLIKIISRPHKSEMRILGVRVFSRRNKKFL